jgi:hypothetical protein
MGALIMIGWLAGLIALIYGLVYRFDPEVRAPRSDQDESR